MNILLHPCPDVLTIQGTEYRIYTDFRDWINYIEMFADKGLTDKEKVEGAFQWFIDTPPFCEEALQQLKWFLFCGEEVTPFENAKKCFSYNVDAPLLVSAFIEQYRIDLSEIDYMHWWKFKALLNGLPDECTIKKYMYYRSVNLSEIKDKDERKRIRKIQTQIGIREELSDEDIAEALGGFM